MARGGSSAFVVLLAKLNDAIAGIHNPNVTGPIGVAHGQRTRKAAATSAEPWTGCARPGSDETIAGRKPAARLFSHGD